MKTVKIFKEDFLNWRIFDTEDKIDLADILLEQLKRTDEIRYDLNELFFETGYIPRSLVANQSELEDEFDDDVLYPDKNWCKVEFV
jgi:hypothetical protein